MQSRMMGTVLLAFLTAGCNEQEKLQKENASLETQTQKLESEIAQLKDIPGWHFYMGVDAMNRKDCQVAKNEFDWVVSKTNGLLKSEANDLWYELARPEGGSQR